MKVLLEFVIQKNPDGSVYIDPKTGRPSIGIAMPLTLIFRDDITDIMDAADKVKADYLALVDTIRRIKAAAWAEDEQVLDKTRRQAAQHQTPVMVTWKKGIRPSPEIGRAIREFQVRVKESPFRVNYMHLISAIARDTGLPFQFVGLSRSLARDVEGR